jgi:hypothetical protein
VFWQYSCKGYGPKYGCESLDLDMDTYDGTIEELTEWCGVKPLPPIPVPNPDLAIISARIDEIKKTIYALDARRADLQKEYER